jgi:hypothetical protein
MMNWAGNRSTSAANGIKLYGRQLAISRTLPIASKSVADEAGLDTLKLEEQAS